MYSSATDNKTFLTFNLGSELFAVNVKYVLEVLQSEEITPVPQTPNYIKGIVNFRGEIIPVVDTFKKFNLDEENDENHVTIVMEVELNGKLMKLGASATRVKDVTGIANSEITPVPEIGSGYNTEFLTGAVKRDERFVLILNVEKIFSEDEIVILSKASEL